MAIGGLMFLSGVVFFKSDGIIPFAHAIWHCFVFFGAAIHYFTVYNYLIVPSSSTNNMRERQSSIVE
jgi:monocyte to macrophage differentiation protein